MPPPYAVSASDDAAASGTSGIKKVGYSTVKSGGKLKWLPYNSDQADPDDCVLQAQHVVQSTSDTADDPFGDRNSIPALGTAAENGEPLILPSAGPGSPAALPKIRASTRSPAPKTLVAQQRETGSQSKPGDSNSQGIGSQTLEQALAAQNPDLREGCLSVKDLKKISQLSTNITPSPGELPQDCPWGGESFQPRCWSPVTFTWTASALCHHPLYFEDVQVERYGHTLGPWLQPFASAALFYLTVPILPYKMGLELPDECMYSLGYYRPGDWRDTCSIPCRLAFGQACSRPAPVSPEQPSSPNRQPTLKLWILGWQLCRHPGATRNLCPS